MEVWALVFWFGYQPVSFAFSSNTRATTIEIQNEWACKDAARSISQRTKQDAICINAFDGRVLFFSNGREVP